MSVIYLLSGLLTFALCQVLLPLHPLVFDQETPVTLFDTRHEQCPTFHCWIQFNSVICFSTSKSKTARPTPFGNFVDLVALGIKLRSPLPVATSQDQCGIGPGMIMHIVRVRLQKLMHKDVEWESVPVFEKHVVAFQVRFAIYPVHDNTVPIPLLKEFFNHSVLYTEINKRSRKNPASCRVLFMCVQCELDSELV